jgi:hypothetical protein
MLVNGGLPLIPDLVDEDCDESHQQGDRHHKYGHFAHSIGSLVLEWHPRL